MYSTYEQCTKITYQALDLLNVKQFLKKDAEPRDILWAIEDYMDDGDGEEVWAIEEFMKKYLVEVSQNVCYFYPCGHADLIYQKLTTE